MKQNSLDLTTFAWTLYGTMPYAWRNEVSIELGLRFEPEIGPVPATVPGSVQKALIDADVISDWRYDLNTRSMEWIENRHWVFSCNIPKDKIGSNSMVLDCAGLDYSGWIYFNASHIGSFSNSFIEHSFPIDGDLVEENNLLRIIFREPPRWLGQLGFTSKIREWKPRFNYTWDWIPRTVQTGITGTVSLRNCDVPSFEVSRVVTNYDRNTSKGNISLCATVSSQSSTEPEDLDLHVTLLDGTGSVVARGCAEQQRGECRELKMDQLEVKPWYPNGIGDQSVYTLLLELGTSRKKVVVSESLQVGFKEVVWESCEGAPEGATPWICMINGTAVFLQGVNWTPISPTFADVTDAEIEKRLQLYKEMGCNLLRVWGGAVLESRYFYAACDRLGLMVWQELPLSSSGIDNWPPEDQTVIDEIAVIAESYIKRRMHHVSLLMYSGGNELQGDLEGAKTGTGKPIDFSHPMMARLKDVFKEFDGTRRFIPTSPFGPRFKADMEDFGKGLHWSIHGPWNIDTVLDDRWNQYWSQDDSLFRAETGCPGTMDLDRLKHYVPSLDIFPIEHDNPVWGRTSWWIESDIFEEEFKRPPADASEYFDWSQDRQFQALRIAAGNTKKRFPSCGGIIIWMGHDCFPCAANTSVIDVDAVPKPAYYALKEIFTSRGEDIDV